jgi:hypothetical protein
MAARVSAAAWLRVFSFSIFGSIVWRFDGAIIRMGNNLTQEKNSRGEYFLTCRRRSRYNMSASRHLAGQRRGQKMEKRTIKLGMRDDLSPILREVNDLVSNLEGEARRQALNHLFCLRSGLYEFGQIDSKDEPALGTGNVNLWLKPSDGLLMVLAALRTGEFNSGVINTGHLG